MCTPPQLLFLIKHFEGRVTVHLFWALTGTVNIIEIIYHQYSNRHGVQGRGLCGGGGLGGGGGGWGDYHWHTAGLGFDGWFWSITTGCVDTLVLWECPPFVQCHPNHSLRGPNASTPHGCLKKAHINHV